MGTRFFSGSIPTPPSGGLCHDSIARCATLLDRHTCLSPRHNFRDCRTMPNGTRLQESQRRAAFLNLWRGRKASSPHIRHFFRVWRAERTRPAFGWPRILRQSAECGHHPKVPPVAKLAAGAAPGKSADGSAKAADRKPDSSQPTALLSPPPFTVRSRARNGDCFLAERGAAKRTFQCRRQAVLAADTARALEKVVGLFFTAACG